MEPESAGRRVRLVWMGKSMIGEAEAYLPPWDIYESGDTLFIEMELPGVKREAIEVSVENNLIVVEGRKVDAGVGSPVKGEKVSFLQIERKFGRFRREIELPVPCDTNHVRARLANGILIIELKKVLNQRGIKKRIKVE